jgi:hypothetical protein
MTHASVSTHALAPPAAPTGDFPDVDRYREILSAFDLSRFPKLDKSMIRQVRGGSRAGQELLMPWSLPHPAISLHASSLGWVVCRWMMRCRSTYPP